MYVILTVRVQWLICRGPEVILEWRDSHCVCKYGGDADLPLVVSRDVVIAYPYLRAKKLGTLEYIPAPTIIIQFYNTIQLYCLCVEKFAFWLVIYIKTFNTINNKTSTTQ